MMLSNLITENNLLATAAAAIVHRMSTRRRPRVFRPDSPSKKNLAPGMSVSTAILKKVNEGTGGSMGAVASDQLHLRSMHVSSFRTSSLSWQKVKLGSGRHDGEPTASRSQNDKLLYDDLAG